MFDWILFAGFPYIAVVLAVVVGIYRYLNARFTFSSLSSQFLENRALFFGSVPWHYAILLVLGAHLLAFLFPGPWAWLVGDATRRYVLELIGLMLALAALVGIVLLFIRRLVNGRILAVTSVMDWVLLADLLLQVALGLTVALVYRWGSDWYVRIAVPWLYSLVTLNPQVQYVNALPLLVQLHLLNGFLLFLLFPFTRLVHVVVFPITYLWRPYQVVIWNRRPRPRESGPR